MTNLVCKQCERRRADTQLCSQLHGGDYRTAPRWGRSWICAACALDLIRCAVDGTHHTDQIDRWSVSSLQRFVGARVMPTSIPPTKTHHDLAAWLNGLRMFRAVAESAKSNTDIHHGKIRVPGRGRRGVKLTVWWRRPNDMVRDPDEVKIYEHDTSECYRKHAEARAWIKHFLNNRVPEPIRSGETMTAVEWVRYCRTAEAARRGRTQ